MMSLFPADIISFLNNYGYGAAFLAMLLTGPLGDVVSGFFVATKVFYFLPIFILSVAADLASDVLYYEIGRRGGRKVLNKMARLFSWPEALIARVEQHFQQHGRKTLAVVKFTHGVGALTQMLAGAAHMPRRTYISINIATGSLQSLVWVYIGMVSGNAWERWLSRVQNASWAFTALLAFVVAVFLVMRLIQSYLSRKLE